MPDLDEEFTELQSQISRQRDRIARAKADYVAELIDGEFYQEIRRSALSEMDRLEKEILTRTGSGMLQELVTAKDPAEVFKSGDLSSRRAIIATLVTVSLFPHPRGIKEFNPETVRVDWKTIPAPSNERKN